LFLCIKPSLMDFDCKIHNQCFNWIYPHNAHHPQNHASAILEILKMDLDLCLGCQTYR
jgi:hypothetical protein